MGYGHWTRESFLNYSAARGRTVDAAGNLDSRLEDRQIRFADIQITAGPVV